MQVLSSKKESTENDKNNTDNINMKKLCVYIYIYIYTYVCIYTYIHNKITNALQQEESEQRSTTREGTLWLCLSNKIRVDVSMKGAVKIVRCWVCNYAATKSNNYGDVAISHRVSLLKV